jgi:hypothetical protein
MTEFIFSQTYAIWRNEGLSMMVESMNPKTFEYEVGLSQIIEEGTKKKMVTNEDELREQLEKSRIDLCNNKRQQQLLKNNLKRKIK